MPTSGDPPTPPPAVPLASAAAAEEVSEARFEALETGMATIQETLQRLGAPSSAAIPTQQSKRAQPNPPAAEGEAPANRV